MLPIVVRRRERRGYSRTCLLISHDPMWRGYRAAYPLRPPYGEPIPRAVQQVFPDQAPPELRPAVLEKLGRVTF